MEEVVRNVAQIDVADRRALEHMLGKSLDDHAPSADPLPR
jgi:hypothetical protein